MSSADSFAVRRIFSTGPTRIGVMIPASAASTTAPSEASSHGWATAVGTAAMPLQRARSASYLPVPRCSLFSVVPVAIGSSYSLLLCIRPRRRLSQHGLDPRQSRCPFTAHLACCRCDGADRGQRLCPGIEVVMQHLWDCGQRAVLVEYQGQEL